MFSDWYAYIAGAIQFILDALQTIVDTFDPFLIVLRVLDVVVAMFPDPADFSDFYIQYIAIFQWLAPTFQLANHFVNLPVFGSAVFFIIVVETFINVFRAWRTIRSFVT